MWFACRRWQIPFPDRYCCSYFTFRVVAYSALLSLTLAAWGRWRAVRICLFGKREHLEEDMVAAVEVADPFPRQVLL